MEKIRKFVIGFIFIFFALGATAFFWEWLETEKKQAEYYEEQMREHQLTQGLYSSKLFGIQINQEADWLLLSLQNIGATYGNVGKVFEDTGLLKNTEKFFLTGSGYSVQLNDFINEVGIEEARQFCIDAYKSIKKYTDNEIKKFTEEDCSRPINKNKDFSEYHIKYHPYGYKIWSIIGKLNKNFENKKECVQNLKPYANILFKTIREKNSNKDITVEDKFYPNEKFPKISFNIMTRTFNKKKGNLTILTIEGHCLNKASYISLNAPLLKPSYGVFLEIEQKIRDKKKLNIKENFDEKAKDQEKSIDTQGLQ